MLYFPILWVLSLISYALFFIILRKAEKKHNVYLERFPGNSFPRLKGVKKFITTSTETNKVRDFKFALIGLYSSRLLFVAPIIIYFISAFFV